MNPGNDISISQSVRPFNGLLRGQEHKGLKSANGGKFKELELSFLVVIITLLLV